MKIESNEHKTCVIKFRLGDVHELRFVVLDDEYDSFDYCLEVGKSLVRKQIGRECEILSFSKDDDIYLVSEAREKRSD